MEQKTKSGSLPRSRINAILAAKCPQCRKGDIFPFRAYDLKHFAKMYESCTYCGRSYEVEPGFFMGAMYVSYAFCVFVLVLIGILMFIIFADPPVWLYAVLSAIFIVILHPVIFRYSRVIYLHLFGGIRYSPNGDK